MKLNIQERLVLVNLLPEKGSFTTMSIVEGLKEVLYPSEKEIEKFELKQTQKLLTWNSEGIKKIEIKLTDMQEKMLIDELEKLSEEDSLDLGQYAILKRFKTEKNKKDVEK